MRALRTEAGVATPLLSGGYLIDVGDAFPTFTPDRDHAKAELYARATTNRRGQGEVGSAHHSGGPTVSYPETN